MTKIPRNTRLVDDKGYPTQIFYEFLLNPNPPMTGSGSPEGVIEARVTTLYMDTSGAAGNILYIKRDEDIGGDRTQGWILV